MFKVVSNVIKDANSEISYNIQLDHFNSHTPNLCSDINEDSSLSVENDYCYALNNITLPKIFVENEVPLITPYISARNILLNELAFWAVDNNISQLSLSKLLKILKKTSKYEFYSK